MEIKILRNGIDSLYVAFRGALGAKTLAALSDAKERAIDIGKEQPAKIMGISGMIQPNGGGKSGYSYLFDTGKEGGLWKIKKNDDPMQWNLFVEIAALNLAVNGYQAVKSQIFEVLESWNANVVEESINRVDWAVDFVAPDFVLSARNFVNHSHCGVSERSKEAPENDEEKEDEGSQFRVDYRNRKVKTITVGKMPNRQIQVYDKRQEQIYRADSPWFAIWGFDKKECPIVWRVELRAGKKYLKREPEQKKDWDIRTFEDLEAAFGVMFQKAMSQVRIIVDGEHENISRADNHPVWEMVADELVTALEGIVEGEIKERVRTESREQMTRMFLAQTLGVAVSWAVATGHDANEAAAEFSMVMDRQWRSYAKGKKFKEKYKKAANRLKFLNSEGVPPNGRKNRGFNPV